MSAGTPSRCSGEERAPSDKPRSPHSGRQASSSPSLSQTLRLPTRTSPVRARSARALISAIGPAHDRVGRVLKQVGRLGELQPVQLRGRSGRHRALVLSWAESPDHRRRRLTRRRRERASQNRRSGEPKSVDSAECGKSHEPSRATLQRRPTRGRLFGRRVESARTTCIERQRLLRLLEFL